MMFEVCGVCTMCPCGVNCGAMSDDEVHAHEAMHAGHVEPVEQLIPELPDERLGLVTTLARLRLARIQANNANMGRYGAVCGEVKELMDYVAELQELVRWAALAYHGNTPTWLTENQYHQGLKANARMIETWKGVVGPF